MNFSLLHPTARVPDGWVPAASAWEAACDNPVEVEYVLAIDAGRSVSPSRLSRFGKFRLAVNTGRRCTVDAWNIAALVSTGKVLVCVADDYFPCPHWDTILANEIGDLSKEAVVWVNSGHHYGIMICPILTRAYYERPGRGGCPNGELFYPEYISMGSDDDFTEYSWKDGVIIDARGRVFFDHRHPSRGMAEDDGVYQFSARPEVWEVKERVITRRRQEGFIR